MTVKQKTAFAKNLRRLRGTETQAALAARIGVSITTVARWELGLKEPRLTMVRRIAETLGVEVRELF